MIYHPQANQIRAQCKTLIYEHGYSIAGREKIIPILMAEYGINDRSACQYLAQAKKRIRRKVK